jgi:hypothetical protein
VRLHPTLSWFVAPALIALVLGALALLWRSRLISRLYEEHLAESRRERLFIASVGFVVSVAVVRGLTEAIHHDIGPFHDVSLRGRHIHHLVWGILTLLLVGYLWLLQVGTGTDKESVWFGRLTSVLYGVASALTLDEFALWLDLRDVYWEREGRASLEALAAFFAILCLGLAGGPFFRALVRHLWHASTRAS